MALLLALFCVVSIVKAADYNESKALHALYYSFGTFCDVDSLKNWNCKYCNYLPHFSIESVIDDPSNQLLAFTGYDSVTEEIVLSFRGSSVKNWKNWIIDTDWAQVTVNQVADVDIGEKSRIHRGFYRAIHSLLDAGLYDAIEALLRHHTTSNILMTGHSLGGALAQLLALMFKVDPMFASFTFSDIEIITFGSPRWASKDVATYFNSIGYKNWRVINKYDLIPTLPVMSLDFYHPARQVEYTEFGSLIYVICEGDGEESNNCESYKGALNTKYHVHYLNVYEDQCGKKKPRCRRRRFVDDDIFHDNASYCLPDEYFPNITGTNAVSVDKASSSKQKANWVLIAGILAGSLLVVIFCTWFLYCVYQRKERKQDVENNYHQIAM